MKSGIHTPKLRSLRPILGRWITLNDTLAKRWSYDPDVPWWYNERASVSVLAGAAWLEKGHAFEEYSGNKKGEDAEDCAGRFDLEFSIGKSEFRAEAKQCWLRRGGRHDLAGRVSHALEKARTDIKRCPSWGMQKLAIVFGVPSIRCRPAELSDHVDQIIEQARKVEADATAWVFPMLKKLPRYERRIYPGTIMWIKKVAR